MSLKKQDITNRKKTSLSEGFLDGDEEAVSTPETTPAEETEGEEEGDSDPSDEVGEDEDLDSDGDGEADEFEGGDGEEAGVEPEDSEEEQDLKDTMQSLITAVQALTDKMSKEAEGGDDSSDEESSDDSGDDFGSDEDDDFGGDEDSDSESEDEDFEGDEGDSEEGDSEESSDEGDSEESSDDSDKSEAFNYYSKPGRPLHEKSNYLIGKMVSGRYDLLEEPIMAIVKAKIKQRVEGAKKEFRAKAYREQYGE